MIRFTATKAVSPEDRIAIQQVLELERYARDRRQWDLQASCYTDDCIIAAAWFQGSAKDFVARSREQVEQPGVSGFHYFMPASVRVQGNRALTESACQVMVRCTIEGIELDWTASTRAFSRIRRENSRWMIASLHGIYQKDSLAPAIPGTVLPIKPDELKGLRASYRMNIWLMSKLGYAPSHDILGDDRPEVLAGFYQEAEDWLAEGDPPPSAQESNY